MTLITPNKLPQAQGSVTNHEIGFERLELRTFEAFDKHIDNLVQFVKIANCYQLKDNFLTYNMIVNFHLLHACMKNGVRKLTKRN